MYRISLTISLVSLVLAIVCLSYRGKHSFGPPHHNSYIDGRWAIESIIVDGQDVTSAIYPMRDFIFANGCVTVVTQYGRKTYTHKTGTIGNTLCYTVSDDNSVVVNRQSELVIRGIYYVKGDIMVRCLNRDHSQFPADFSCQIGSKKTVFTLIRIGGLDDIENRLDR